MVAFLVEFGVIGALNFPVALGWDNDFCASADDPAGEVIGVVSLVGKGAIGLDTVDQIVGEGDVVALTGRTDQADGQTERLGGCVDFCTQPAARPAQALGIRPPLTLRAPAAC